MGKHPTKHRRSHHAPPSGAPPRLLGYTSQYIARASDQLYDLHVVEGEKEFISIAQIALCLEYADWLAAHPEITRSQVTSAPTGYFNLASCWNADAPRGIDGQCLFPDFAVEEPCRLILGSRTPTLFDFFITAAQLNPAQNDDRGWVEERDLLREEAARAHLRHLKARNRAMDDRQTKKWGLPGSMRSALNEALAKQPVSVSMDVDDESRDGIHKPDPDYQPPATPSSITQGAANLSLGTPGASTSSAVIPTMPSVPAHRPDDLITPAPFDTGISAPESAPAIVNGGSVITRAQLKGKAKAT